LILIELLHAEVSGGDGIFLFGGCLKANLFYCNNQHNACFEQAWQHKKE